MPFCIRCGASNAGPARYCAACGEPLTATTFPAAPPPAQAISPAPQPLPLPAQAAPAPAGPALAALGDRLLAVILDALVGGAVFAVAGMWTAERWGGVTENGFSLNGTPALIAIGLTALAGFLYYWLGEGVFGATFGKGILGIAVQRIDGHPCGLRASLIRNLFRLIDGFAVYLVGFLVAVFSASRQRLGDHVARTIVVRRSPPKALRGVLVALWLAVLVVGACGAYALHRRASAVTQEPVTTTSVTARQARRGPLAVSGDLKLVDFAFLQGEDGPRRPTAPYKRGDTVYIKYDVGGLTTGSDGKIDLLLQVVVLDPGGLAVHPLWEKELRQTLAGDHPVNGSLNAGVPSYAPAGTYRIEIKARDKFKNTQLEYAPTFQVEGAPIAPAAGLELRDFGLSLTEDGQAIGPPVFDGGGTIRMRWKVAGMQARDDRVNLRVGLKVFGPDGKAVLDAPDYVSIDDSFTYRPSSFFLSMSGHVSVPTGFPKGAYTGRYLVTDYVSNAQIEHTAKLFEVR